MSTKALITVEQFAQMNFAETEDFELVDGELVPLPSTTPKHNLIRESLNLALSLYFRGSPIGKSIAEVDCRITSETVRRPSVSIFLDDLFQQIDLDRIPIPFAPHIAVEVLSPTERAIDVRRKVLDYLRAGSHEVWLVDHANGEILVHTNAGIAVLRLGQDRLTSPLLPGFSAGLDEILKP